MSELFTAGRTGAGPRLFCFPPAGAGPSIFAPWRRRAPRLDLRILALPGREGRVAEDCSIDIGSIADAVQKEIGNAPDDRAFAFYGHSLGGLLAYETAAELRGRGAVLPTRMFFGASRPPITEDPLRGTALLPDDELLEAVRRLGGVPSEILQDPELRELVLRPLRHDFRWLHDYTYTRRAPLPVPMVVISGIGDTVTDGAAMRGWGELSTEPVVEHSIDGGHLFVQSHPDRTLDLIEADLIGDGPNPARGRPEPVGLVPLPGTDWQVWGSALLRTAGFPADGLLLLSAPDCAAAADDHLAGRIDRADFDTALTSASDAIGERLRTLASEPALREAIVWQNPGALTALDKLAEYPPHTPSSNKRRKREKAVAQYWARYCGKNDTIGFFGPVCWAEITNGAGVLLEPGPGLTRRRAVHLEWWVLQALADSWAGSLGRQMPVRLQPQHSLIDGQLHRPGHRPLPLSPAEHALLSRCDGRPAQQAVDGALADAGAGFRKSADVELLLDQLADRELVRRRLDLPLNLTAEEFCDRWLAELADRAGPEVAAAPRADLDRLFAGRDAVAAAAGDADALLAAMTGLGQVFTELTGREPAHRAGRTYAGRGMCFEDTERDLEVTLGADVLHPVAASLTPLLQAARWLTESIADSYAQALRTLHRDAAQLCGSAAVPLADMWLQVWSAIFSPAGRPMDPVLAGFADRWERVLGLTVLPAGTSRLDLEPAELARRVHAEFPAIAPGWPGARVHSPDLVLCADGPEALRRGDFTLVLGELHAAWLTCSAGAVMQFHPDPAGLRARVRHDLGARTVPLYPEDFETLTARLGDALVGPGDLQVGYKAAPVHGDVVPVAGATVVDDGGDLLVRFPDGQERTLVQVIAEFLAIYAQDAFKLMSSGAHTPRITVGPLVLVRETWRTTVADSALAGVESVADRYLAARRWAGRLGLPDQVFVKVASEIKPIHVDLTSPVSILTLCTMMRSAEAEAGGDVGVTVSEMLPTPDQACIPDAEGRRYFSELRIYLRDPEPAPRWIP